MTYIHATAPILSEAVVQASRSFYGIAMSTVSAAQALFATSNDQTKIERAIAELQPLEDYQLNDIGLCRSDLTPDGLAAAGMRRSARQHAIDLEIAEREGE